MKKFRIILVFVAAALIIGMLFTIDFDKILSKSNFGPLLGILAMILVIINMFLSNRHEAKK